MVRHRGKFVSYLRVSTKRQGESGLGLEAQRHAVETSSTAAIGSWSRSTSRSRAASTITTGPALQRALEACKVYGATLVIAKLDRLCRDAHFLLGLQKAGVKFVAADMPEANEMVVGIMALVAQAERRMISERTKAALQAAKARGVKLGNPKGTSRRRLRTARGAGGQCGQAQAFAERLRPVFAELAGLSANAAAAELERRGIATAAGGRWTARVVIDVRRRLEGTSA